AGFASASGHVTVSITNNAFQLSFDVTFHLGPLDVHGSGFAGIYNDSSPGIALNLSVSIDFDILDGIFHIGASGTLTLNTTGLTRNGIGPHLFRLSLNGTVSVLAVLHFDASFTIQVGGGAVTVSDGTRFVLGAGEWVIDFSAGMNFFSLATLSASGWLKSDGTFHIHLHGGILLGTHSFGLEGTFDIDIRLDDVAFTVSGHGQVWARLFGITLASLGVGFQIGPIPRTGRPVEVKLSVTVEIEILFVTISKTATFTIGYLQLPKPIHLAGSQSNPVTFSGGTLYLNTGDRASSRGVGEPDANNPSPGETYTLDHVDGDRNGETIKVTAYGKTQTFAGVTRIVGNTGNGNNQVTVNDGVLVPVE